MSAMILTANRQYITLLIFKEGSRILSLVVLPMPDNSEGVISIKENQFF